MKEIKKTKNRRAWKGLWLSMLLLLTLVLQGCGSKSPEPAISKETPEETEGAGRMDRTEESADSEAEEQETVLDEVELTDTVRWFNASYAVLTELNGWDYNRFGGLEPTKMNQMLEQELLVQWWGVTDRTTADETLEWIVKEGHRMDFAEEMVMLEEAGMGDVPEDQREAFLMEVFELEEASAQTYARCYGAYEQYGENAITGWDCCRAMNLLGFYYLAGYYTQEEALDMSLEIAQTIQPLYESWDELIMSYMYGYEYWAEESSQERWDIYEDIKGRADSPYNVDFKMTLEKTW